MVQEDEADMPFQIVRNDITAMHVDAIVNSANPRVKIGYGVDSAIYKKAGWEALMAARTQIGEISPGSAVMTPAFGLSARVIIHTVGPVWEDGNHGECRVLRSCYDHSLQLAAQLGCESIAFPLISTGTYGFPKNEALQIAVAAIREFLDEHEMDVYLVVFNRQAFELSGQFFDKINSFIDEKYVRESCGEQMKLSDDPETGRRARRVMEERSVYRMPEPVSPKTIRNDADAMPSASFGADRCLAGKSRKKRSLEDVLSQVGETFSESVMRLIREKEKDEVEVYKKANIDRKLFSKIRNKSYKPSKKTAISLAIALELNLDEAKDLLARGGFAFSPGSISDLIVEYFIINEVYDIYLINLSLFEHDQPTLS